jgi:hypothetical protein
MMPLLYRYFSGFGLSAKVRASMVCSSKQGVDMNGNKVGLGIVAGTVAMAQVALATEYDFLNARAGGMGGTGAVSTRDATVQWYNPAVLGFMHQKPMEVATTNEVVSEAAMTNEVMAEAAATNESMDATSSTNMLDESSLSSAPLPPTDRRHV